MQQKIAAFVQASLPEATNVTIDNLRRVAGGMSTENWLFDGSWELAGRAVQAPMVLRCAAENEIVETTREHEFLLLTALSHAGLPVPKTFWMDCDGEWMGAPAMVLERCVGRADRALLQERNSLGLDLPARRRVAEQIADALADIHKVEIDTIAHLRASKHESSTLPAERELAIQETALRRGDWPPDPELVLASRWLRAHLPTPPTREAVVHGDFRPANMLIEAGTLTAVLDWELAHRGDPAEDLGWYLAPVYRHEHFIPGQWNPEDFLNRYQQRAGIQVDPAAVRFWSVFATYKLAVIALHSARSLAAGDHARLGPPAHRLVEALMRAIAVTEKP